MADWVKIGIDVGVGAGIGAADQFIQNWDEKREAEAGVKLSTMKQAGTYFNYGFPIGVIIATAFGFLKGDMATRLVTVGAALAGRKGAWYMTKRRGVAWTPWTRSRQLEEQRRRAAEAARLAATGRKTPLAQVGTADELTIPIISEEEILV